MIPTLSPQSNAVPVALCCECHRPLEAAAHDASAGRHVVCSFQLVLAWSRRRLRLELERDGGPDAAAVREISSVLAAEQLYATEIAAAEAETK